MSDPYNHNGPAARGAIMLEKMRELFVRCSKTPAPDLLIIPQWMADRIRLHNDTPPALVGHEHWYC